VKRPVGGAFVALAIATALAGAERPVFIRGLEASPVSGVTVRDSAFRGVVKGGRLEHVEDLVLRNVVLEPAR